MSFFIFVLLTMLLYYFFPLSKRYYVLLFSSILFYLTFLPYFLPIMLLTVIITYMAANKISTLHSEESIGLRDAESNEIKKKIKNEYQSRCKKTLRLALLSILLILCTFKYSNFIIENINFFFIRMGIQWSMGCFSLLAPVGISFYTFMSLGYLLDIYWRRYDAENNFLKYMTFSFYFPHIVQGPISRYNRLSPQLIQGHTFDYNTIVSGGELILWGLFKKMVIADRINIFVSMIYDNWILYNGFIFIIATILYSIQIYTDFSGCIDIVRGTSELFGIKLDNNFNHPYFSKTMPEFWRRWHMSLNEWFKDYLYYPISMSKFVKNTSKK